MTISNVILITIIAVGTPAMMALPLIYAHRGWEAWQSIPKEVYASERMRLFRQRPLTLWAGFGIFSYLGRVCKWWHWPAGFDFMDSLSTGILCVLLVAHLIWAVRLLRRGDAVDVQLRRFARYAAVGASIGLGIIIVGVVSDLLAVV